MHIALITFNFPPETGGVQTMLGELFGRIGGQHQVSVFAPVPGRGDDPDGMRRFMVERSLAPWFWAALRTLRPDRVVVGHIHPQLLMAARLTGAGRFSAFAYGNDYLAAQKRWHRPITNYLAGQARPLITITQANANILQNLGLPEPRIIYPGTDPGRFYPDPQRKADRPTLLTVSRLVSRKGIDTVLQALPGLVTTYPDLRYQIVGDGPDRARLEKLAVHLGLEGVVQFTGRVSDAELLHHYQQSTLFVMPAREEKAAASMEGFGIVYLEAAACGLPVIAGRSGGAVEAVQNGVTGFLVTPDDVPGLQDRLRLLLATPDQARQMGAAGRRWVETKMNWDRAAQQLLDILEDDV
jgi:phosphatidylinositol alpha-1,6-mannosyltransferase